MQPEACGVDALGCAYLGERVPQRAAPDGFQATERRPVGQTAFDQRGIEVGEVDGLGARRRPLGQGGRRAAGDGEGAGGVHGPRLAVTAVHADAAAAVGVRGADPDLHLHASGRQHERGGEDQVLDRLAADLRAGREDRLELGGAGDDEVPGDLMVGEPRVPGGGPVAGEEVFVGTGQRDGGAEQRVVDTGEAEAPGVPGRRDAGGGPVPLLLERVGGQVDTAAAGGQHGPVHRGAPHVRLG